MRNICGLLHLLPGVNCSSQLKYKPFSLFFCISSQLSLLNPGTNVSRFIGAAIGHLDSLLEAYSILAVCSSSTYTACHPPTQLCLAVSVA